ncbi:MAG: GAF domain-containing sensor histidine kinase [Acidimicrobiia bacterium]
MTEPLGSRDLSQLIRSAAVVASQAQLQDVLQATVERGMKLTGARYGAIGVVGPDGLLIDFHFAGIDDSTARAIGHYPEGKGILGLVSRGSALRLDRIADHAESVGFPPHHPEMETFLGVPIQVGDRLFGNLYLTEKVGGFTDSDQAVTESLAVIAASAISNARASEELLRAALIGDRARIARDLHDAIIQDLYAVGLSLQSLSAELEGEGRERINAAVDQLDMSIAALRRFIFDLRPPIWARRQLAREIRSLVTEMSLAYKASIDLSLDGDFGGVSESTTETASLVVRESLSNALRHANAAQVAVDVRMEGDTVTISVVDDGVGFNPEVVARGMGLDNIALRVTQRGGELKIKSAPGSGTDVAIRLPR